MEDLVRRYRRPLLSWALARTATVADAEDVVQTVLLRVLRRGGLDGVENPRGYLLRAVENLASTLRSRRRPAIELPAELPGVGGGPSGAVAEKELGGILRDAIAGLPPAYRTTVWLVHVEGLDIAETARLTGAPRNTVKSALARGRRLLRERLGPILRKAGYLAV